MSLKRIVLKDFVIVDELDLEFSGRFTVLTGETGAGKSILIDALQWVTGGRADPHMIREGSTRADVSAEFDPTPPVRNWLTTFDFESEDALLLRRTVDTQGKSRAWINGGPATTNQLRTLGELLLDIHGQHAWQSLTRADTMLGLLDAYAQVSSTAIAAYWQQWRNAQQQLEQARNTQKNLHQKRDQLTWQIGEVEKLAPGTHEWQELNAEHTRLSNAQDLLDAAQAALDTLGEADVNAIDLLAQSCYSLQTQERIEPVFKQILEVFNSCTTQLQDSMHTLRAYARNTELDPDRLTHIDDRMGLWMSLARRYKCLPEELPALFESWRQELAALDAANDTAALQRTEEEARQAYLAEAQRLGAARQKAAPNLAKAITRTMQQIGMKGGRFDVVLSTANHPTSTGLNEVSFLVAGHYGSTPRPVHKVASGGELSRLALAIAVTTSRLGQVPTLIFDEVDSGVGGAVAQTIGHLLQQLGQDRQVLAVTHLPQVAACGDFHLVVSKELQNGSTLSTVKQVEGENRVIELARMLGGTRVMDSTMAHARDLLRQG